MTAQPGAGRRILIVEDDDLIRRAIEMVLQWEGYQVDSVENGQAALDYLHAGNHPSLIILDIMMPVLDGEQFRRLQLNDPTLADIPVIVVSAADFSTSINAVQHIRKPFQVQELLEAIHHQATPSAAQP